MSEEKIFLLETHIQQIVSRLPSPEQRARLQHLLVRIQQGDIEAGFDLDEALPDLPSPVQTWLKEKFTKLEQKQLGMESLAGNISLLPASQRWVCPEKDCNEDLPVIQEDEAPPTCPRHTDTRMVRQDQLAKGQSHAG